MITFSSSLISEGSRYYLRIPEHPDELSAVSGRVPAEIRIGDVRFETLLLPKGNGNYVIPVRKSDAERIRGAGLVNVELTLLSRRSTGVDSAAFRPGHPIRVIDSITYCLQPDAGFCGQACVAMLAGVSFEEALRATGAGKWQASIRRVIETLTAYGFSCGKPVYTMSTSLQSDVFPKCCLMTARGEPRNHMLVYFDGVYYDPTSCVSEDFRREQIISYMEIKPVS